jgi:hypothetical protein
MHLLESALPTDPERLWRRKVFAFWLVWLALVVPIAFALFPEVRWWNY